MITCVSLVCVSGVATADNAPRSQRVKYNFNAGWKLFVGDVPGGETVDFNDSNWKNITTPRAWNEDDAFRKDIKDLSTGIVWYRKHFKLSADSADKKVFLEFEGIRHGGDFYLNGKLVGRHENGVMAFALDLTAFLKPPPQENVFAARIDNDWNYKEKSTGSTYQWADRNFYANYGGINKNVFLHITSRLYQTLPLYSNLGTTGVYVYGQDFSIKDRSARITTESQVKNEFPSAKTFTYQVVIADLDEKIVKTIDGGQYTIGPGETKTVSVNARLKGLNFWSWGYGYLYKVYSFLKLGGQTTDVVCTRTGFRKLEFSLGMVKLNDRAIQLKGYAQRTTNEWPALGSAVPAWVSDFSNRLMLESNANLVRWMHVTPWKQDVESLDRLGLMEAVPAGDSERDVAGRRWEQRLELMRDAIIYNRNNPSIIFYEAGNKGISAEHMQQMKALRDRYDAHGGRAAGCREMLDSKIAEYGGEMLYINKSASKPLWAMEYSRDESLRKYWDEFSPPYHQDGEGPLYQRQDASAYNRNQDSQAVENVIRWFDYWHERPGTGARVNAGGVNIIFSDSNTHHRGAENYRRSGEVDAVRLPKDGYFANRVMWDGWVDVERPRTHIVGHWNYAPGTRKSIFVVSSAEKVELLRNGKSLGYGEQSNRFLYTFKNVEWEPGTIRAVGYDAQGVPIAEASKTTSGTPAAIRLTPHTSPRGLRADGADLALVDVEVVDAQGDRCPTALNLITFSLSGPAEWRGGIAQGPDNYILSEGLPVENGVNRVIIRSAMEPGKIVLSATAAGLNSASCEFSSLPVKVADGLSLAMPDDGLRANLERGPTTLGESFTITRKAVSVARIIAGANEDQAFKTMDDNETTAWSSDGKIVNAWIRYDFERPANVGAVTMKLSGWRTTMNPVRILVDERVVFAGDTPRSLGYVTFSFPAVTGRSLKIELTGDSSNRDAFGNIVEIPGTPDPQSAAGYGSAKNTLSIVELEIYEGATDSAKSSRR